MIGLYGISGCGKSYLLNQLKLQLPQDKFAFYDGSTLIDGVVSGGLFEFKKAALAQQTVYRELAISKAANDCQKANQTGVVAGHYMFWSSAGTPETIGTDKDWETYTHIVYLNVDPEIIASRTQNDKARVRENASVEHLRKWQHTELSLLRSICIEQGILFTTITEAVSGNSSLERLTALLTDFQYHSEAANTSAVMQAVETALPINAELQTVLMLDADRTLAPQDTGLLF
jgi:adenylate kinase